MGGFWSAIRTFDFWKAVSGCDPAPIAAVDLQDRDPNGSSTVSSALMRTARPGAGVDALRASMAAGHRFPSFMSDAGLPRLVNSLLGPQNHDIDGPEVVLGVLLEVHGRQGCRVPLEQDEPLRLDQLRHPPRWPFAKEWPSKDDGR